MSLHRAVMVRRGAGGIPDLVKDEVQLGGVYILDMSRQGWLTLKNNESLRAAWAKRADNGSEGMAPLALFEIDEGEVKE